jgi:hypothetical protein
LNDLNRTIRMHQTALVSLPEEQTLLSSIFTNLSNDLRLRFERTGLRDDLENAMKHGLDTVRLTPSHHANWTAALNNLSLALRHRIVLTCSIDDFNNLVDAVQQSVDLTPKNDARRLARLNTLCFAFQGRMLRKGSLDDATEALRVSETLILIAPENNVLYTTPNFYIITRLCCTGVLRYSTIRFPSISTVRLKRAEMQWRCCRRITPSIPIGYSFSVLLSKIVLACH